MSDRRDFSENISGERRGPGAEAELISGQALKEYVFTRDPFRLIPGLRCPKSFAQSSLLFFRSEPSMSPFRRLGNGKSDCTDSFRQAIEACTKAGGGRVLVPAASTQRARSISRGNVNLNVAKGATSIQSGPKEVSAAGLQLDGRHWS